MFVVVVDVVVVVVVVVVFVVVVLHEFTNQMCRSGILCFSKDRHPMVGEVAETPGQFVSVGYHHAI
jgi:hypothetical protein